MKTRWPRVEFAVLPLWLVGSLAGLGLGLAVFVPIMLAHVFAQWVNWSLYFLELASTVFAAWLFTRRYTTKMLERSDRGVVYWIRYRTDQADVERPPSTIVSPK